jgi:hypothetical protein
MFELGLVGLMEAESVKSTFLGVTHNPPANLF